MLEIAAGVFVALVAFALLPWVVMFVASFVVLASWLLPYAIGGLGLLAFWFVLQHQGPLPAEGYFMVAMPLTVSAIWLYRRHVKASDD